MSKIIGPIFAILFAAFIVYIYGPLVADSLHEVNRGWCKMLDLKCEKPPCVFRMGRDVCIR
jgi:hypothetical protein